MVAIEGFSQAQNAVVSIHKFRETINHILDLLRELDHSLRDFEKSYLKDEYEGLADKYKQQAYWHIAGIGAGALQIGGAFLADYKGVFEGISSAATQSVGIGQKFCDSSISLQQGKIEEIKKKIDEIDSEDREIYQEIDQILNITNKIIDEVSKAMSGSINMS
ncbi:MAG: hypothetical protein FJZ56_03575 [Chlamydiae bacterium]|nr:hypothetical protein [Chlamydiota bacterium]